MYVLCYIGDHANDGFTARAGWATVRAAQVGATYKRVTHVEAVLAGKGRNATIASSSLRDGGVRTKVNPDLDPSKWIVFYVPAWDVERAIDWFAEHDGEEYDIAGAVASVAWFLPHVQGRWYCNESIGASQGLVDPHRMTPAAFCALMCALPGTRRADEEFFAES